MMDLPSAGVSWGRARASRLLSRFAKVAFALAVLVMYTEPLTSTKAAPMVGGGLFAVMWAMIIASYTVWFVRRSQPGSIAVDDSTLRVVRGLSAWSIPRTRVKSAYEVARVVSGVLVPTVEIVLDDDDVIAVRLENGARATELVDALGFGASGKSVT